jgi:hypothetical protein
MNTEQMLQELYDRIAIRDLIDRYAICADTRDAQGQMAIFTEDTNFEVFYDPKSNTPSETYSGRKSLFPVFDNLNSFMATMHFNGQSTLKVDGDMATGITYCRAHHLNMEEGVQKTMIAGIRYYDTMVKQNGAWLFSERKLKVAWIENIKG